MLSKEERHRLATRIRLGEIDASQRRDVSHRWWSCRYLGSAQWMYALGVYVGTVEYELSAGLVTWEDGTCTPDTTESVHGSWALDCLDYLEKE